MRNYYACGGVRSCSGQPSQGTCPGLCRLLPVTPASPQCCPSPTGPILFLQYSLQQALSLIIPYRRSLGSRTELGPLVWCLRQFPTYPRAPFCLTFPVSPGICIFCFFHMECLSGSLPLCSPLLKAQDQCHVLHHPTRNHFTTLCIFAASITFLICVAILFPHQDVSFSRTLSLSYSWQTLAKYFE